jgi:hypothetical protein
VSTPLLQGAEAGAFDYGHSARNLMNFDGWEIVLVVVFGGLLFSGVLTSSVLELGMRLLSSKGKHRVLLRVTGLALILGAIALTYALFHLMYASWR